MVLKAAAAGTDTATPTQWVVFRCGSREFGVPLASVTEILLAQPYTRLPGAGADVCGIAGVRGHIITVLDFGVLLGMQPSSGRPDHRVLLLDTSNRRLGAVVDEVTEVAPARITASGRETDGMSHVIGSGRSAETEFTALDPVRLIAHLMHA